VVPGDGTDVWGEIHMNKGRVGEERRGKEMDRCPLTAAFVCMIEFLCTALPQLTI
jgi:hypothetical protein